mgnify:CR=1 FL=1
MIKNLIVVEVCAASFSGRKKYCAVFHVEIIAREMPNWTARKQGIIIYFMNVVIKEMQSEEAAYIEKLYESSFPSSEKKPFSWMAEGNEQMNVVYAQGRLCGLLFTLENENSVLIDYLAIDPEFQGSGIGTKVLGQLCIEKTILSLKEPRKR